MKKRKPVIALLLSMLVPGLGQIYNTDLRKGLFLQITIQLSGVGLYILTPYFSTIPIVLAVSMTLILMFATGVHIFAMVDAYRFARNHDAIPMKSYNKWYYYVLLLLLFWAIGISVDEFSSWKSYNMAASSMEPTVMNGDRLLVNRRAYSRNTQPRRGDVIVFVFPEDTAKDFLKRVIGVPGDNIAIRDRIVFINGKPIDEEYAKFIGDGQDVIRKMDNMPEIRIPEHKYYVLGDNRDKSYDSRFWGFVDREAIIGKAMFVYYSPERSRILQEIK